MRAGLSEEQFWHMTIGQVRRHIEADAKRRTDFFYDHLNAVGVAFNGKEWKVLKPPADRDAPGDVQQREASAIARHRAYVERYRKLKEDTDV